MTDSAATGVGFGYTYNTKLEGSRLIAVEVWDTSENQYLPLERLKLYSFAAAHFICAHFDRYPQILGKATINGEVPAVIGDTSVQSIVADYLTQLNASYDTRIQERLINDTTIFTPMNFIQEEWDCPDGTIYNKKLQTCPNCPEIKRVSFLTELVKLKSEKCENPWGKVLLSNREVFNVSIMTKSAPNWIMFNESRFNMLGNATTLMAGGSIAIDFYARPTNLMPGTTVSTVLFGVAHATDSGCLNEYAIAFDVSLKVLPKAELNQLGNIRAAGLTMMALFFFVQSVLASGHFSTAKSKLSRHPKAELNQLGNIRAAGLTMMAIVLLCTISFGFWTFFNRKVQVVRASQPMFLIMICVGIFVMGTSIFPLSIDDGIASVSACNIACMAVPWLASMGFTIAFSALFSKIWRIYKLVESAKALIRLKVTEKDVMAPFAILFGLNFSCLLAWTLVDPLLWVRRPVNEGDVDGSWNTYGTCQSSGKAHIAFLVILLIIDAGALLLSCVVAYYARNISDEFSESKYLGVGVVSWLQLLVVGLPILFLIDGMPVASYFLKSAVISALCLSMLLLVFVPKLILSRRKKSMKGAHVNRTRASTTGFDAFPQLASTTSSRIAYPVFN
eukprot:CAMPEP_0172519016 /NCGR_PEP_ID=MMETSP1066-20121228/291159_1 /TAXON_ID=671091 /ORGANISM="Coscinodiscus wailesii, Strain CCMP2513" /LENGTH=617 /DNA_ID=CAMNT_0013301515 /DNA_START=1049 /DNA_END=2904 /DNA_ORIENTATION=-